MYKRVFGSWKAACECAGIPWSRKKKVGGRKADYIIGEIRINNQGDIGKIVDYNGTNEIVIEFQDEKKFRKIITYSNWKKGTFKNPYRKNIFGIGCVGNSPTKINNAKIKSYMVWYAMMQRCYDTKSMYDKPTYEKCLVSKEWHCYEDFIPWFNENYYEIQDEEMCLDKDILIRNNHIYSPDTCIFVPQAINKLFTKRQLHRGKYPIGVSYNRRSNSFAAACSKSGKYETIGYYNNPYDAFLAYKHEKELIIKIVAEEYKSLIPQRLYDALIRYEVYIND